MANTKIKNTVLDSSVISGQSTVTAASGDFVLIQDISDSDNLKKALVSDFGSELTGIDDQSSSNDDQLTITDSAVIINEDSDDVDFRVEGNGEANLLFVNAGDDRVGIGTASPASLLHIESATAPTIRIDDSDSTNALEIAQDGANGSVLLKSAGVLSIGVTNDSSSDEIAFKTRDTTRMTIDDSGQAEFKGSGNLLTLNASSGVTYLKFAENGTSRFFLATLNGSDGLAFVDADGGSTRMKIFDDGDVGLGGAETGNIINSSSGVGFYHERGADTIVGRNGGAALSVLRQSSDGELIRFKQAGSQEGSINVSGASVSLQGFTGTHETSGIADDTAIGTVVSTIDELDTYVSGSKSGQTRAEHPKIKVSDSVGDSRVYGVLQSRTESDNKPLIASVGLGTILVTGACSGGDLLESNGDGTAKVQDDDIIRSKTIGKVTIGDSNTGVKSVSCVLYCG